MKPSIELSNTRLVCAKRALDDTDDEDMDITDDSEIIVCVLIVTIYYLH